MSVPPQAQDMQALLKLALLAFSARNCSTKPLSVKLEGNTYTDLALNLCCRVTTLLRGRSDNVHVCWNSRSSHSRDIEVGCTLSRGGFEGSDLLCCWCTETTSCVGGLCGCDAGGGCCQERIVKLHGDDLLHRYSRRSEEKTTLMEFKGI